MTFDAENDRYKTRRELEVSRAKNMNEFLESALRYASIGLAVFPVNGKIPCTPKGFYDATTDETQIRLWWEREDPPGIAIATGEKYGLVILDIDPRNGGDDSFEMLQVDGVVIPDTPMVLTGGGGRHYYLSVPKGIPFKGRSAIRPGVDLKADAGYCVAPPSMHASGKPYAWELSSGLDIPFAEIPSALLAILQTPGGKAAADKLPPAPKTLADSYPEGTRHGFILSALGLLRRKNFSRESAMAAIREENRVKCKPPFSDLELTDIVADVFKRWAAQEDVKIKGVKSKGHLPPDDGLTDLGNAKRFVAKFGAEFRYSHVEAKWYQYTGVLWRRDSLCGAQRAAATISADLREYAEKMVIESARRQKEGEHDEADRLLRTAGETAQWAKKSEAAGKIAAVIALAAPMLQVEISCFDGAASENLFNFRNGTMDMRTGTLREHRAEDYITSVADYDYDPNADAPFFGTWLVDIMGGRTNLAQFVIDCFGYTATGSCKEQVLFCCYGPTGANGKGVLFDIMASVFGDYWTKAPSGMLEESQTERHPTALAGMVGKRLITSIETGVGKKMDENLVKELTGGDRRSCRRMYEDFWTYIPTDKWWVGSNHRLRLSLDPAIVRRLVEIPFDVHYWDPEKGETGPDHLRVDKGILEKLRAEIPGIARYIMHAAKSWLENGLKIPGEVLAAVADYKADMDAIGEWITDRVIAVSGVQSTFADLYRDFIGWCERTKSSRLSSTAFSIQMQQKGHGKIRDTKGRRAFAGIVLKDQAYPVGEDGGSEGREASDHGRFG